VLGSAQGVETRRNWGIARVFTPYPYNWQMSKTHKTCLKCLQEKPIDEFYLNSAQGSKKGRSWNPRCKPCVKEWQREHYKNNPRQKKNFHLKYRYGITIEDYEKTLKEQNNQCAICKTTTPGGRGTYFHVDHNHLTGQIRGLLCHHCNIFLGSAQENVGTLKASIEYLNKWGAEPSQP
jgi:hypothetical protein